jgi:hypothetical protein
MTGKGETIDTRDLEFDSYEEMKAFVKGIRYEFTEHGYFRVRNH